MNKLAIERRNLAEGCCYYGSEWFHTDFGTQIARVAMYSNASGHLISHLVVGVEDNEHHEYLGTESESGIPLSEAIERAHKIFRDDWDELVHFEDIENPEFTVTME